MKPDTNTGADFELDVLDRLLSEAEMDREDHRQAQVALERIRDRMVELKRQALRAENSSTDTDS